MGTRQKARDSKRIQDLQAVKNALRMYYNDNQSYPEGEAETSLSSELGEYLPGINEIDFRYYQTDSGDGFNLCVDLETSMGSADVESQLNCGLGTSSVCGLGVTTDKIYAVCAN